MAVYEVVKNGEPVLRTKAKPVPKVTSNIHKLLDNMVDTMYASRGVGLAAPQIGVSKQVLVLDVGDGLIEVINPEIIESSGTETGIEGCLSIPGIIGEVPRAVKITVKGLDREGQVVTYQATGMMARAFQHEIDHLNGVLFIDIAQNIRKDEKLS
ncbi:MAG: peptide deformylase [Desulfotomaculum sp.]|nr:peptide deformylase [Desulfotomaculum sp.]MCL0081399.1 peptide deformylase [Peptococcaceae bacterium]